MIEQCIVCDICGTVGDGAQTASQVREQAKESGWHYIRVDGRCYDVCNVCVNEIGGMNPIRRRLREAAAERDARVAAGQPGEGEGSETTGERITEP